MIIGGLANQGRLSAVGERVSIDAGGRVLASGYVAGVLPHGLDDSASSKAPC